MKTDLRWLYGRYVDYVTQLQDDFARHVGANVSAAYRPQLLSFDDFCRAWQACGEFEGVQEAWQRRLEDGYAAFAQALSLRLKAALCPADHDSCERSVDRAA